MTDSLQDLERRIEAAAELHAITRTMRGMAAVNLRHHERAAEAIAAYDGTITRGLEAVLRDDGLARLPADDPPAEAPAAMFVFGSNQGLCGPVNRHVALHALAEAERWPALVRVGAVGARIASELELAGLAARHRWDLPGTVEGITPVTEHVLVQADRWRDEHGVERVLLVFPGYHGRTRTYEPTTWQLAPTDRDWLARLAGLPWRSRSLPAWSVSWDRLVAILLREAMLARLHRCIAQTMASIAASRLAAMDVAQRDIEDRLDRLRSHRQQVRQAMITEELLDVVSGFEVLHTAEW